MTDQPRERSNPTPKPMFKLNASDEWYRQAAEKEGDHDISAGASTDKAESCAVSNTNETTKEKV